MEFIASPAGASVISTIDEALVPMIFIGASAFRNGIFGSVVATAAYVVLRVFFGLEFVAALCASFIVAQVLIYDRLMPGRSDSLQLYTTLLATAAFTALAIMAMTGVIEPWATGVLFIVLYVLQARFRRKRDVGP